MKYTDRADNSGQKIREESREGRRATTMRTMGTMKRRR
jgi:hypothetical protein